MDGGGLGYPDCWAPWPPLSVCCTDFVSKAKTFGSVLLLDVTSSWSFSFVFQLMLNNEPMKTEFYVNNWMEPKVLPYSIAWTVNTGAVTLWRRPRSPSHQSLDVIKGLYVHWIKYEMNQRFHIGLVVLCKDPSGQWLVEGFNAWCLPVISV